MHIRYSYLREQFSDCDDLWADLKIFVESGDFTLGKALTEFEENFATLIGSKYAIGVNSGTDAIKLSLKAYGIGVGDEVITAANTFVATVGAICEIGAKPVFVDCDDSFCMDVEKLERAISPKTKAIVPVHYAGVACDMDKIMTLANKYNLFVIEDAAQAIDSFFIDKNGIKKALGSVGHLSAFSFHETKNIISGEGGLLVVNDDNLVALIKIEEGLVKPKRIINY